MVWIIKKGISCLLILLGVTFVTFFLMQLAGGDAISCFYENQGTAVSQEIMEAMRRKYGLDQPFFLQYGHWLLHALTGDMGEAMYQDARCFRSSHPRSRIPYIHPTS